MANKKLALELPKDIMCCFVSYVYATADGMSMASTAVDGDDLLNGHKICKGADGYEEAEIS